MRAAKGEATFAYDADIAAGKAARAVHAELDPKRVAGPKSALAGQNIREARDSEAHPVSNAVAVLMDVTGSMQTVPQILQKKLVELMNLLLTKSALSDPAILIGAIGDATCDDVPLQLGQFESGIEIENDLTKLFLEGGGGGSCQESYELGLYFLARKTAIDCFEKRSKKGYAFLIGDEMAYGDVRKDFVKTYFGDDIQSNIPLADILAEAQQKWDIYMIMPNLTHHYGEDRVVKFWRDRLGQNFIMLDKPEGISELLASIVAVGEGAATAESLESDLTEAGTEVAVASAVSKALAPIGKAKGELAATAGTGLSSV